MKNGKLGLVSSLIGGMVACGLIGVFVWYSDVLCGSGVFTTVWIGSNSVDVAQASDTTWLKQLAVAKVTGESGQVKGISVNSENVGTPEVYQGSFFYNTSSGMLSALGVVVYPEDKIVAFPDPALGIGSTIQVFRAKPVLIEDGKSQVLVRTWASDVESLLAERNIDLGDKDKVVPDMKSLVYNNEQVRGVKITRVAETEISKLESIDFTTKNVNDPNMDEGQKKVMVKGVLGSKKYTYLVHREDGIETSRKLINTEILNEPVAEVINIGTRPVITVKCKYNDLVLDASIKNGIKANDLCTRMIRESNGNPNSDGGIYKGMFQYEQGLWNSVSVKAGFSGASIWDAKAQIYVTAWAWANGYRSRWPIP